MEGLIEFVAQGLGALGALLLLLAYWAQATERLRHDSYRYLLLNLFGSMCLAINTGYLGAYIVMGLNATWCAVAIWGIIRITRAR